jgi:hypothetical protein
MYMTTASPLWRIDVASLSTVVVYDLLTGT